MEKQLLKKNSIVIYVGLKVFTDTRSVLSNLHNLSFPYNYNEGRTMTFPHL